MTRGSACKRQTSPATSLRRKTPWGRRSRAASGGRHRGLRAPRSASMAWALRARRLRLSLESGWRASVHARNFVIAHPDQVASSGQIFETLTKAENLQAAFAGGGKGLARGAARPALAKNLSGRSKLTRSRKLSTKRERICCLGPQLDRSHAGTTHHITPLPSLHPAYTSSFHFAVFTLS